MNWGFKLTIGMIIFMGFIVYLGTRMMKSPTQTVEEKYYEKGLHYSDRLEKLRRGAADAPSMELRGSRLFLSFNARVDSVDMRLIRPQDTRLEKKWSDPGPLDSCDFHIDGLKAGRWKMILEWKSGAGRSALETDIVLP